MLSFRSLVKKLTMSFIGYLHTPTRISNCAEGDPPLGKRYVLANAVFHPGHMKPLHLGIVDPPPAGSPVLSDTG